MKASTKSYSWTEKPTLHSSIALACVAILALLFAYFKMQPLLEGKTQTRPYREHGQSSEAARFESGVFKQFNLRELNSFAAAKGSSRAQGQVNAGSRGRVRVIERPLLDGLSVTIRATLNRSISSLEPDRSAEATLIELERSDETRGLDDASIRGAKLTGLAVPNFDLKRMNFQFVQLVTLEGRSYAVQGVVVDPETRTAGVRADFASGLPSRLLGVGISRAMTAGDQILMANLLPDPGTSDIVKQATQQAARQLNEQAANDLSLEATRGLRETKPELFLPAGTFLTVRLRVLPERTGGSND